MRIQAEARSLPIRRLTHSEADDLGYSPPIQLGRLQVGRFGMWRPTKWYCVETSGQKRLMTLTKKELANYGISPEG